MTSDEAPGAREQIGWTKRKGTSEFRQILIVLAGIVLGQALLYGPCLTGRKILLPLDILASQNVYLPRTPEVAKIQPRNVILSDLVYLFEPERRFAASEIHAGRLPMWASYHFAGAPFIWPKFSPFLIWAALFKSPIVLAWVQLLAALVAGLGAYFFCRQVLIVGPWPATFAAWCYPLTGFFVLSQGFTLALSVYWLPWMLLATDTTIRRSHQLAPLGLAAVTGFVLTSGQLDVAGQVLLVSGCYAIWCWLDEYWQPRRFSIVHWQRERPIVTKTASRSPSPWGEGWGEGDREVRPPMAHGKRWFRAPSLAAALRLGLAVTLGLMLALPYVLPVVEYGQTGARVTRRSGGLEERAPVGLKALPQVVLPKMYGSTERGSFPMFPKNQGNVQESSALTYAGLVATLFVAPLAFSSRRHRSINIFWILLGILALSWSLNFKPVVYLLRLPGLNLMSHNRLVFAASFAILALSATGLDLLWRRRLKWRWWFWIFPVLLAGLCGWCVFRVNVFPEPLKSELAQALANKEKINLVKDLDELHRIQAAFSRSYITAALLCSAAIAGWIWVLAGKRWNHGLVGFLAILLVTDLIAFSFGRYSQCDPSLYYPTLPVLDQLSKSPPGRVIGFLCLPALLASTHGLDDIRGFDPVVPGRFVDLMDIAADSRSAKFEYALLQWMVPKAAPTREGDIRLSPILDMLNVRYVIFRGAPIQSDNPFLQGPDYWVVRNLSALPRAFVPRSIEVVPDDKARLEKLASPNFNPRLTAYVETPVDLPASCSGSAEIMSQIPNRIKLNLKMDTAGLVVLADLWDRGWRAYLNGKPAPILRVNHAIRGVVAPAGSGTLEFKYEPASFAWGLRLAGLAAIALGSWGVTNIVLLRRCPKRQTESPDRPR